MSTATDRRIKVRERGDTSARLYDATLACSPIDWADEDGFAMFESFNEAILAGGHGVRTIDVYDSSSNKIFSVSIGEDSVLFAASDSASLDILVEDAV
tara:strand:- start:348 stop:641 length:294 start_codon:yes stop_codon:yes gene_type:complete